MSGRIATAAKEHQGIASNARDPGVNVKQPSNNNEDIDMKKLFSAMQSAFGVRGCGGPRAPLGWRWVMYHNI